MNYLFIKFINSLNNSRLGLTFLYPWIIAHLGFHLGFINFNQLSPFRITCNFYFAFVFFSTLRTMSYTHLMLVENWRMLSPFYGGANRPLSTKAQENTTRAPFSISSILANLFQTNWREESINKTKLKEKKCRRKATDESSKKSTTKKWKKWRVKRGFQQKCSLI